MTFEHDGENVTNINVTNRMIFPGQERSGGKVDKIRWFYLMKNKTKHGLPFFILFHPLSKIILMNLSTTHDKNNFLKGKNNKEQNYKYFSYLK